MITTKAEEKIHEFERFGNYIRLEMSWVLKE